MEGLIREDGTYTITLQPRADLGVTMEYGVIVPEDLRDCQDEVTLIRTLIERDAMPIEGSWRSVSIEYDKDFKHQPLKFFPKR